MPIRSRAGGNDGRRRSAYSETPPGVSPLDPYIYAAAPRCRSCGSKRLPAYRTSRNGDDSITRHVTCSDCHAKWLLVIE